MILPLPPSIPRIPKTSTSGQGYSTYTHIHISILGLYNNYKCIVIYFDINNIFPELDYSTVILLFINNCSDVIYTNSATYMLGLNILEFHKSIK